MAYDHSPTSEKEQGDWIKCSGPWEDHRPRLTHKAIPAGPNTTGSGVDWPRRAKMEAKVTQQGFRTYGYSTTQPTGWILKYKAELVSLFGKLSLRFLVPRATALSSLVCQLVLKYSTHVDVPMNASGLRSAYQPLCMCVWNGDRVCRDGEVTAEMANGTEK